MALVQPHRLVSTILIRTLMDHRYFHGIRTAATEILARNAREEIGWVGRVHLEKAFQEFFCYSDSPMTRSNDFSDRASYYIQCAIPKAFAKIRNASGHTPFEVRNFLYEKLKYNDNSTNEVSCTSNVNEISFSCVLGLRLLLPCYSHASISRSFGGQASDVYL